MNKTSIWLFALSIIFAAQACLAVSEGNLYNAAREGSAFDVKRLIRKQADIEFTTTRLRRTPLQAASFAGHADVVALLLSAGANVNASDKDGWTALLLASNKGHTEIAGALLSGGADVNARTHGGAPALKYCHRGPE